MEATIKLDEDEVIKLCVSRCNDLLLPPEGMRWVGMFQRYSGVTMTLEEIPFVPLVAKLVEATCAPEDQVPF